MEKPMILLEYELKKELTEVANKYIKILPASMVANAVGELHEQTKLVAETELQKALENFKEKEKEECQTNE